MRRMGERAKTILDRLSFGLLREPPATPPESAFPSDPFVAQHELMKTAARGELCIFDVGAYRGDTVARYRSLFPNAEIYGFEVFPDSVTALQERFAGDRRTHIVPKAVGREQGTAAFHVNAYDATNSLLPRPASERRYYPKTAGPQKIIEVEVTTLDAFMSLNAIAKVDILKFDIQGGELDALHGAGKLLADVTPPVVYTEVMFVPHYEGSPLFHDIAAFLAGHGYSLFDLYQLTRATNGQLRQGDGLFVSHSMRAEVIDRFAAEP